MKMNQPLYDTISTVGLSMGIEKRWGEITEVTIHFHLDPILVYDSLLHRAGERRRGEERRGEVLVTK